MLSRRRALRGSAALLTSVLATSGVGLLAAAGPAGAAAPPRLSVRTVLTGLDAPRGIAFDGSGAMYVAQSGKALPGPAGTTRSGSVSRYARGSATAAWRTSFTSLHDALHGAPEALGPEGLSVLPGSCPATSSACEVRMIMSESHDGIWPPCPVTRSAPTRSDTCTVFNARQNGPDRALSDVGNQRYAWTKARKRLFPDDFPDSNPYAVLLTKDGHGPVRTFVADAGANTISEVPPERQLFARSPTSRTRPSCRSATRHRAAPLEGPDGNLDVATLHLVANIVGPNAKGGNDVLLGGPPRQSATTTRRSQAVGHRPHHGDGLHVRPGRGTSGRPRCSRNNGSSAPPGDVVRIRFNQPTKVRHFGGGQLPLPGGIAQAPKRCHVRHHAHR